MANPNATEKATPKRRREAREKGQVPRSPDLGAAAVFLVVVVALHLGFPTAIDAVSRGFANGMAHLERARDLHAEDVAPLFLRALAPYTALLGFSFVGAVVVAVAANVAQFGILVTPLAVAPRFGKLNPLAGAQRLFLSPQTLVQLGKQLVKLAAVALIVWSVLHDKTALFYALAHAEPREIALSVEGLLYDVALRFGVFLLVLAVADYAWERTRLERSLRMTKTEVRDEHKQQEGSSEVKGAVKQRQRAMARKRMMAAVPTATVVVTNPTHFAVALRWDEVAMDAPVVVAKGADLLAKRIRELAAEHAVPVLENKPLARTLYDKVELDSPVPPDLYAAVAQVIAFVYRLKNRTIA